MNNSNTIKLSLLTIFILVLVAVNAWFALRLPVSAAGEPLTIAAPVTFSAGYTISSAQFIDNANSAYFLDPAATGNSLLVAGNIGIGTTGPTQKLDVTGGFTRLNGIRIGNSFPADIWKETGTGDLGIYSQDGNTVIQPYGGNVGIGTTSPGTKLSVAGDIQIANGGALTTVTGGTSLNIYPLTSGSAGGINLSSDGNISFLKNDGNVQVKFNNGNVGIGTTSPSTALQVVGTITGTTKNFEINHPTKPGMKLVHSTVEGPEVAVFYRGESTLVHGKAVVVLPDYFEALTRSEGRTVQLTAKNGWSPLYVDGEVINGRFSVKADSGNSSQRFFWEVKAVRADVEPLVVEKSVH